MSYKEILVNVFLGLVGVFAAIGALSLIAIIIGVVVL